jgi:anti-sigma factor RsiW
MNSCSRSADIPAYVLGLLSGEEAEELRRHIEDCRDCAAELAAEHALDAALAVAPAAPPEIGARISEALDLARSPIRPSLPPAWLLVLSAVPAALVTACPGIIPGLSPEPLRHLAHSLTGLVLGSPLTIGAISLALTVAAGSTAMWRCSR